MHVLCIILYRFHRWYIHRWYIQNGRSKKDVMRKRVLDLKHNTELSIRQPNAIFAENRLPSHWQVTNQMLYCCSRGKLHPGDNVFIVLCNEAETYQIKQQLTLFFVPHQKLKAPDLITKRQRHRAGLHIYCESAQCNQVRILDTLQLYRMMAKCPCLSDLHPPSSPSTSTRVG